ncbi:MAG: Flp pilus assembly protein CpaB [Anaerolineae bacterium]|nr:Flp pilus assembly protein CpaB [Anaerolineae bacterium]
MRNNRGLVLVALFLIVVVIAGGGYWYWQNVMRTPDVDVDATPIPEPVEMTELVVAIQNIPRGMQIRAEDLAIELQEWPNEHLPYEFYAKIEDVDGKFARMDIPRGMPVLPDMLGQSGGMLSVSGSSASLFAPSNLVAYAIPLDTQGAVAWAIQPGDRVDVLAAFKMMAVDPGAYTEDIRMFTILAEEDIPAQTSPFGRFEVLPNGRLAAIYDITGDESMDSKLSSLIVQLTVQNAVVWHVGLWQDEAQTMTPQAAEPAPSGALGNLTAEAAPTPMPSPVEQKDIEPVTLLVTREDALVLKYLHEMGADLDLVLRPANYTEIAIQTQPVWFRYVLDKYQLPNAMPDDPVGPLPMHEPLELLPISTPEPEQ